MENIQTLKTIGIGTKESTKLKPTKVKIETVEVRTVGEKGSNKVVCNVKHPDNEDTIEISSVSYRKGNKIENSGLWINLDDENLLRKGSALATLLVHLSCANIEALQGRECQTEEDEKGYLTLKCY